MIALQLNSSFVHEIEDRKTKLTEMLIAFDRNILLGMPGPEIRTIPNQLCAVLSAKELAKV